MSVGSGKLVLAEHLIQEGSSDNMHHISHERKILLRFCLPTLALAGWCLSRRFLHADGAAGDQYLAAARDQTLSSRIRAWPSWLRPARFPHQSAKGFDFWQQAKQPNREVAFEPLAAVARAAADPGLFTDIISARRKATAEFLPFSPRELDSVVKAIENIIGEGVVDKEELQHVVKEYGHTTYKVWADTEVAACKLAQVLPPPDVPEFKRLFFRVLEGGNFKNALEYAKIRNASKPNAKPWAVLVSGLNGIRKTTSIYQPWFQEVLYKALRKNGYTGSQSDLPAGHNMFFRQLDFIVATLANEDFRMLYTLTEADIDTYAALKEAIFARYRKLAEMVGMMLMKLSRSYRMNVAVETSGRDVAMYGYIDHCFPDEEYNKLVVHFTINNISFACDSVDRRMKGEMGAGARALQACDICDREGEAECKEETLTRFLPKVIKGKSVLIKKEDNVWQSDNSQAGFQSSGLASCFSKDEEDKDMWVRLEWGSFVQGVDDGDGWVKIKVELPDEASSSGVPRQIRMMVEANAGGPYGSAVLPGVEAASNDVYKTVQDGSAGVGANWYKAALEITGHDASRPWTVRVPGSKEYAFDRRPGVNTPIAKITQRETGST